MEKKQTAEAPGRESGPGSTWVDPTTGLEWQCTSPGLMAWDEAVAYAASLSLDGRSDWRLPAVQELESLLDRSIYRPEMRPEVPFRDTRTYWSATTFGSDGNTAWIVMFDGAYVLSYYKTNRYWVRCLRGVPGSVTPK